MPRSIQLKSFAMFVTVAVVACHHPAPMMTASVPAPAPTPAARPDDTGRRDSIARADAARRDSIARDQAARADRDRLARENAARRAADMRTALEAKVYFDYDRAELRDDARTALAAKASVLKASPGVRIRIEGNADERGSDEFNLALGMQRAAISKRYLVDQGIQAARIDIISYGEEQPACREHAEACWWKNRRDEFTITAGADQFAAGRP
jgi:peptidoglycan-associated lipoprotein